MQIYYARGNEVDDSKYESLLELFKSTYEELTKEECIIVKHNRNKSVYNPQLLLNSDVVIMFTAYPDESDPFIGKGLKQEFQAARFKGIPLYLFYVDYKKNHISLVDTTFANITVVDEDLWTVGHAKIVHQYTPNAWFIRYKDEIAEFWKAHFNKEEQKLKVQNKSGDGQNKDSGKRILLLA